MGYGDRLLVAVPTSPTTLLSCKHVTLAPVANHDNVPNEGSGSWFAMGHLRVSPRTNKHNKIRNSQDA